MPYTIPNTDTATSPVTGARSFVPVPTNYAADWRVVSEGPNEVVLSNLLSPLEAPEKLRVSFSEITDIFKGSSIAPAEASLTTNGRTKKGTSILVQLTGGGTDATGIQYPWSCHLVLKIPYGPSPTYANIVTMIQRMLGHLYGTKDTTIQTRMESMLRGSITPAEL